MGPSVSFFQLSFDSGNFATGFDLEPFLSAQGKFLLCMYNGSPSSGLAHVRRTISPVPSNFTVSRDDQCKKTNFLNSKASL
jgi:hypothetical protein